MAIRRAVYVETGLHPVILATVKGLLMALLVLGRRDAGKRAEAERFCREFGLDLAERELMAAQYPDPVDEPDTGV
ncbi:hypothetical protein [Actibacterium sp. 188UL27-1]|uniref:hypothetical protein n=1 Tax=Actibacterium sp. 188UL27-1 TaxID=2786961 RepID=UPI0019573B02|nr:hypothetical protein [Actibacterium sp. 188UL27-1]MBM7066898.1 hypothetical protein [Actibacterium sp. 188UL27-1]